MPRLNAKHPLPSFAAGGARVAVVVGLMQGSPLAEPLFMGIELSVEVVGSAGGDGVVVVVVVGAGLTEEGAELRSAV